MKRLVLLCAAWCLASATQAAPVQAVTEETAYTYYQGSEIRGAFAELTDALMARAGLPYQLAVYPWARAYDLAQAEPDVLIFPLLRTPEREAHFRWVGEIGEIHTWLYRRAERTDIQLSGWEDARRFTVGVVREDFRERFLRNQGFTRLVVSASAQDNAQKLLNGQVDLVPLAAADARRYQRPGEPALVAVASIEQVTAHAWYAYSLQTSPALVERTRQALQRLQAEGVAQRLLQAVDQP